MKKLITAGAMLLSMSAFSQSYLVLGNGVTLTTDKAGFVYDYGNFIMPYKVTISGGQFLVESEKLSTVDSNGLFYQKDLKVKKIKGKGLNYLLLDNSRLVTIDEKGFYYEFEDKAFKKIESFGGNFFTVKSDNKKLPNDLYTINALGNYFKINVNGLNTADIQTIGGNYFQTKNGVVHTVSKDGFVFPKPEVKAGLIKKMGGNFFIDATNKIYTVTEGGLLMLPVLPANIVVANIAKIGANYMLDQDGRIFVVDKAGLILERFIKDHDLRNTRVLSY